MPFITGKISTETHAHEVTEHENVITTHARTAVFYD